MADPVPASPSPGAVRALLAERFDVLDDPEPIGAGAWSRAYGFRARVDGSAVELVARLGRHREDFVRDAYAGGWCRPGLPIPRVLHVGPAGDLHLAVSQRCRGGFLERLDADGWRAVLPSLLEALDLLRTSDPEPARRALREATGTDEEVDLGLDVGWRDWLLSIAAHDSHDRVSDWREPLAASPVGIGSFERGLGLLTELTDGLEVERTPVHSDLVNRNAFVRAGRLTGLIDWGCLFAGDHVYDVAWLEFCVPWAPGLAGLDVRGEARRHWDRVGLEVTGLDRRMLAYAIHIGLGALRYNAFIGNADGLRESHERLSGYLAQADAAG